MDQDEKFTKRDSKADTGELPTIEEVAETERKIRAMSYRERQRQENERIAEEARARGEQVDSDLYINNRNRENYDGFDILNDDAAARMEEIGIAEMIRRSSQKNNPAESEHAGKRKNKKKKKKKMSLAYRVICGILGALIGVIVIVGGIGAYYISSMDLNNVELINSNNHAGGNDQYTQYYEDDNGEEIRVLDTIYEGTETDSFKQAIREWKNQGSAYLQSNKVINVLLVGIDRNDDGSDGRSDTMILASLNLNTKTITLSSFYRDCWMYETFDNDERSAWAKLNATFVYGGANGLIENLEDYYKIHIDHFVGVDFQSFLDIIDSLGGITVPVQEHEAAYINEQLCRETVTAGDAVHLQGDEALWFVRMRHSDSDEEISRTRRQRLFISALIDQFKSTSLSEIENIVSTMLQYVQTDMSKTEIVKYGTKALLGKWYNYEIKQQQVPDEMYRMDYNGSTWVWLVDYPGAAYEMQMGIYGYSNIVLNDSRYTMLDIARDLIRAGYEIV